MLSASFDPVWTRPHMKEKDPYVIFVFIYRPKGKSVIILISESMLLVPLE